jgi:hypothetical protein
MRVDQQLSCFGFKVVDRRKDEVEPLLLQCLNEGRPFEVGLYYHDPATHDCLDSLLPHSGISLNTHIDHRRLSVFALNDTDLIDNLRRQIELSLQWGAAYGINHLSAFSLSRRPEHQDALLKLLISHLRALNRVCREYSFPIYIENTYHEVDLYRRVFAGLSKEKLEYIHFCFDFGHAKIWSTQPLRAWIEFMLELDKSGRQLHFHLHTNRGLSDEHLSFPEAEWMEICGIDDYTAPWNTFEALSKLDDTFPTASKVMEVPPAEAHENLQRVIEEITRIRRMQSLISA